MNNLPKKYKIKCRYAELGATTLSEYPKYHMRALLLQLHYYNYYFPKNIYSAYQGEIRKLKKELTVSKDLKKFYFHYITRLFLDTDLVLSKAIV